MMKNQNNHNGLDERQMQIYSKSTSIALTFALVCLVAATIYRLATTDNIGWELFVIIGICLIMSLSGRFMGDIEAPKGVLGKPLPLGSSKEDKWARIKNYMLESGIFALACAVMDIALVLIGKDDVTDMEVAEMIFPNLSKGATIAVTAVIAFVIMFLISFIFEYVIGERFKVKRYNDLMAKLDADDEEDE